MKRFFAAYLLLLIGHIALMPVAYSDPLVRCTNIGISDGAYTITGSTTQVCAACGTKTVADVNALSPSPGDAILFKAGETFNIGNISNRLRADTGVLYGRYGSGNNPIISSLGAPSALKFIGTVEIKNNDVTFDGIDVEGDQSDPFNHFSIWVSSADNITLSNLTVRNGSSGVSMSNSSNIIIDKIVVFNVTGNPHESITMDNTDFFVIRNSRFVNNGHAAMDLKGGSTFGEVFGSEFSSTNSDPVFYMERQTDFHGHDNWIHDTVGQNKPLVSIGIEPLGAESTWHVQRIEFNNNVVETAAKVGVKMWIKLGVSNNPAVAEERIIDVEIHHNAIVETNRNNDTFNAGISIVDLREDSEIGDEAGKNCTNQNCVDDWERNTIHDNVIWDVNNAPVMKIKDNVDGSFTVSYNLVKTGATFSPSIATNTVETGTNPFVDMANKDFDPAGPALGSGTGGGDIGATINWTCGLGTTPPIPPEDPPVDPPVGTLFPLSAAKPEPYTIDAGDAPTHLWVFSDESPAGTIADEGTGTSCNLALSGPAAGSDTFGKFYTFVSTESDIASVSCTPPATTGIMCAIVRQDGAPISTQDTIMSFGEAADAFQGNILDFLNGSGNPRSAILPVEGAGNQNFNDGPWTATDNEINMLCVRQSNTLNDVWLNGSGWQAATGWSGQTSWTGEDQFAVGALFRSSTTQYLDGTIYTAFVIDGTKTDEQMDTLWNDGDPWAQIGIDPTSGGEPEIPQPAANDEQRIYQGTSND